MTKEEIIDSTDKEFGDRVLKLSPAEYKFVLEKLIDKFQSYLDCVKEEMEEQGE